MTQDNIFATPKKNVPPFEFNEQVVQVFDDMIIRSVPCYREIIRRQAQLAARFYQLGTKIYDLGCSNGNLGLSLCHEMGDRCFEMIAIDNSEPMLATYKSRLTKQAGGGQITLQNADIRDVPLENASVVIVNLTLQFLPVADRDVLIQKIQNALVPGGILLLTEKVIHRDESLSALQQDFYYRFKKENGYSQLEISQKREALENVLIPETIERHKERLQRAGFEKIDIWLKWFNFAAFLAQKQV